MFHEQAFFNYLTTEKRCSPHTFQAYQADISHFLAFVQGTYDLKEAHEVTHTMVRDWIILLLEDEGLSASSVNRKISAVKSYFRYLKKKKRVDHNPVQRIVAPKKPGKLPQFVDEKSMDRLFGEIEFPTDFEGTRDRLILDMFYQTGIRVSELIHVQLKDIDRSRGFIRILGKRQKERFVPFVTELETALDIYLARRAELLSLEDESFLFVTASGKKMYPSLVYKRVHTYLNHVTSIQKKSPHVIRHTFATHMLNRGADLHTIKEILGHANLAATQVYTHNSLEKMKNMYNQAHPRA